MRFDDMTHLEWLKLRFGTGRAADSYRETLRCAIALQPLTVQQRLILTNFR